MSIIALCEKGLIVDLFSEYEATYPSEAYECKNNVILTYYKNILSFYDVKKRAVTKEYQIEDCKQIQLSECGRFGGVLTFKKKLCIYSNKSNLGTYDNVSAFSISSSLLSFSRGAELFLQDIAGTETTVLESIFYFKVFDSFLVLAQKIKDNSFKFKLSVYSKSTFLAELKLEQIEKIDTKSDGKGNFLFLITSQYVSSSYYGHEHLYFFNIGTSSFKEVDVLDPPLFFEFLESRFLVCSGNQPSLVSLYDHQCSVVKSFPKGIRNQVFFNAHRNLVAFCGFENLSGNIDIYDAQTLKMACKFKVLGASLFSWSPNGAYFIVSVTNNMKEDNSIEMYDYYGRTLKRMEFSNLVKSEWAGEKEEFLRLERPEKLKVEKENVYVLPSFGHLRTSPLPRKRKPVVTHINKKKEEPIPENVDASPENIKKELEMILCIKEKQERGAFLSAKELNKLLKEKVLLEELKNLEAKQGSS